ncbi:MAG: tetratricopeptide repeat protein [Nitrospirota bacterium]
MTPTDRVWQSLALGLILGVTALTYRGVTQNGFVLDDAHAVASNPSIASFASATQWFTSPYAASALREHYGWYRPILLASYALDRALWGNTPSGYHGMNLMIHMAVVVAVFFLARRLWTMVLAALTAATLVALHPINAEAVNYVAARSSSLTTLFLLAAVWAYDAAVCNRVGGRTATTRMGTALCAGLLALGTKETGMVLPLLILVWDRARFGGETPWRTSVMRSLPFWALTAVFWIGRSLVLSQVTPHPSDVSVQSGLFAIKIVLSSFGHWFFPVGLAVDHGWQWTIGTTEAVSLIAGLLGVAGATVVALRTHRRLGWCLIWSWVALLPLMPLPTVSRVTLYQDHRVYLAGVGLAWALGGLTTKFLARSIPATRVAAAAIPTVLIVAMIRADAARSAVWVDESRLWEDVLAKYPDSVVALNARGLQALNAGRLDDAERDFEATLRLVPNSSEAHKNLGLVYAEAGDADRALRELQTALALSPRSPGILVELGFVYERTEQWDAARRVYEDTLEVSPGEVLALKGLARAAEREQRYDDAIRRYREALAIDPGDGDAWMLLGAVLVRLERWVEARQAYESVLSHRPGDAQARFNLGVALDGLGDAAAATQAYAQAAASLPRDADLAFRIGMMHARHGRWTDAAVAYEQALLRDPRHAPSHLSLARAAEQLGDQQRALTHYRAVVANTQPNVAGSPVREQASAAIKRLESEKRR